jgi:DNA-binding IclR family transcriptional regulator
MSGIRDDTAGSSTSKTAERLLDVLELLAHKTRPVPTMTIARECGIPKSSTHHLLNVMRARNFVIYYEHEHAWGLGVAAFEIGSAYLRSEPLQRLGRPVLVELTQVTGDTAHLAVLHGTEVLYIDKETPAGDAPKLVTEVGVRLPAHLTAVGRAILAELQEPQVRALFAQHALIQRTGNGPSTVNALLRDLDKVRRKGFAHEDQMTTPGIGCLASPVFSHEGMPVAALGVTYLAAQRSPEDITALAPVVRELSDRLSASLGYHRQNDQGRLAS